MTTQPNKRLIGIFIVLAFVLLTGTFVLIKRDVWSTRTTKYVMYFEGSVKGLSVGAPVVFNGVPVGRVTSVTLAANLQDMTFQIPVTVEINSENFVEQKKQKKLWKLRFSHRRSQQEIFQSMIEKGLRARLIMQSLLTSQMMIELSFFPGTPVVLQGSGNLPEIPTIPSSLTELSRTLQNLPIHQIATNLNKVLEQTNVFLTTLNGKTPVLMDDVRATLADLRGTLGDISQTGKNVDMLISPDSQTVLDLNRLLRDAAYAAQSLRNWADYLERHPEALIKGKGGR